MTRDELGRSLNMRTLWAEQNRTLERMAPRFITVHETANAAPSAGAEAHAFYLETVEAAKRGVIWHYTVDADEVIKHCPLNERGVHAGLEGNATSIGIEVCVNDMARFGEAADRAARLIAALLHDFGWPHDRVVPHSFWTAKACPANLLRRWDDFLTQIRLHSPSQPPSETTTMIKATDIFSLIPAIIALVQGIVEKDPQISDDELIRQVDDLVQLTGLAEVISDLIIRGAVGVARFIQARKATS